MTKSERTKHTIIESAMVLFSEKGYEDTSVDDIVKKSGIGKGTYYYHFKQKEEVLMLIIGKDFDRYFEAPERISFDTSLDAIEKLEQIMVALFSEFETVIDIEGYFGDGIPMHYGTAIDRIRLKGLLPIIERVLTEGVDKGLIEMSCVSVVASIMVRGIVSHIDAVVVRFDSNEPFIGMVMGIEELLSKLVGTDIQLLRHLH